MSGLPVIETCISRKDPAQPFGDVLTATILLNGSARQAGMPFAELHRRAYAGEFPPSSPMNTLDLI